MSKSGKGVCFSTFAKKYKLGIVFDINNVLKERKMNDLLTLLQKQCKGL
uniref:Uncharacterized protein n=1 Tax=Anguilla anguilla TaxID=7936 RepID=A0A0E9SV38_ANGAN